MPSSVDVNEYFFRYGKRDSVESLLPYLNFSVTLKQSLIEKLKLIKLNLNIEHLGNMV